MRICVYCGSSPGINSNILSAAKHFGAELASRDIELVYGGSSLGVMGTLADSVMQNGGRVTGVIPGNLFSKEVAHTGITELITVSDMHERKSKMADLASAFVAMPGGFGTMEELFEIITWNQIGIIQKPITLFNIDGFYDPLQFMIQKAAKAGFIRKKNLDILKEATTVEECIEMSGG
ncbi:TIGR00730 family Rossman fold protein [Rhodohalobacter sp. SW132]|uniref:LOG family protein n=1 Tax=Rhodohalobacter sp. SW132 TaxID=2293433 RepID=UPI0018F4083F|nr:TIGR00730 family Rossman fold protein [Rhodohalobacter sp. SW132]